MALTLTTLLTEVGNLLHDPEVTTAEKTTAINQAIRMARERQLYYLTADESITWATDTWEYSVPAGFVTLFRISHEDPDTASLFDIWVPDHHWFITTAAKLHFDPDLVDWAVSGKKLRLEGQKVQAELSVGTDVLNISDFVVIEFALAELHGGRGGTSSDLSRWHSVQQSIHYRNAELALENNTYRLPPGSRYVPGRTLT